LDTLQMIFRNFEGRTSTISVRDPLPGLTGPSVDAVMDLIISKNIFDTSGGALTAKVGARIVSTTTTELLNFE